MLGQNETRTIGGKPITEDVLGQLSAAFERDWAASEVTATPTERGRALCALQGQLLA
jgi:hypothetical protein